MTKQEVLRVLQKQGEFLTVTQTAEVLGVKRETAKKQFLEGLDYITVGRKKLYLAADIAQRITEGKANG